MFVTLASTFWSGRRRILNWPLETSSPVSETPSPVSYSDYAITNSRFYCWKVPDPQTLIIQFTRAVGRLETQFTSECKFFAKSLQSGCDLRSGYDIYICIYYMPVHRPTFSKFPKSIYMPVRPIMKNPNKIPYICRYVFAEITIHIYARTYICPYPTVWETYCKHFPKDGSSKFQTDWMGGRARSLK